MDYYDSGQYKKIAGMKLNFIKVEDDHILLENTYDELDPNIL